VTFPFIASCELTATLDGIHYRDAGPCVDAIRDNQWVNVRDGRPSHGLMGYTDAGSPTGTGSRPGLAQHHLMLRPVSRTGTGSPGPGTGG
jgi:hypothetical protein